MHDPYLSDSVEKINPKNYRCVPVKKSIDIIYCRDVSSYPRHITDFEKIKMVAISNQGNIKIMEKEKEEFSMKRHISLLLAVFMLATLLPMGVMADGEATHEPTTSIVAGEISTIAGEIALDFAAEIDEATLGGIAITATTPDKTFKGGLVAEVDGTDASIVHVRFGNLEDGVAYKLTVPASVKDVNGNYLAEEAEFAFTAKTEWLSNTDFSEVDYVVGSAPTQEADNIMYIGGGKYSTDYAKVMSEENTNAAGGVDKFVRVGPNINAGETTAGSSAAYGIVFSADTTANPDAKLFDEATVDEDKVVVIEAGVRVPTGSTERYMGMQYVTGRDGTNVSGNAVAQRLFYFIKDPSQGYLGRTTEHTSCGKAVQPYLVADSYGWHEPMMVLKRNSTDDKTYVHIYDNAGEKARYYGYGTGGYSSSTTNTKIALLSWYGGTNEVDVTYSKVRRERLLSPFGTSEYDAENKKITVYMTDDIDTSTVSTSTVSVSMDTTPVTISSAEVDETGRGITLTFPTELGNGDYTVSVAGLKDADGILGYDTDFDFNVNVIESPYLAAPTVSVEEGNISTIEGELVITFKPGTILNDNVDELITFKKGGNAIKGLCKVEKDSVAPYIVRVTFGKLEDGVEYTLTIPTTVGSTEGKYLENPVTINYTAKTEWLSNTDFSEEDYVAGSAPTQEADNIMYIGAGKYSTSYAKVMSEENTNAAGGEDKFVRVGPNVNEGETTAGGSGAYGIVFSADTTANPDAKLFDEATVDGDKVVIIESGVRVPADATERYMGMQYITGRDGVSVSGNAAAQRLFYFIKDPGQGYLGRTTEYTSCGKAVQPYLAADSYGWHEPMMVLKRNSTDDKTYIHIYDNAGEEAHYYGYGTGGYDSSTTNTKIALLSWYSDRPSSEVDVTYVRVRKERLLSVMEKTAYTNAGKQVVLYMSDDIDESTIGTLSVTNSIGNNDKVNVTPDYANRTVTLTFPDGLIIGDHNIDISGLKSKTTGLYASDTAVTFSVSEEEAVADEINNNIGIISLSFDKAVDPATINGISFTKAAGAKITGAVIREVDAVDPKKVNLKFGKLEDGVDYKLTVPTSVKDTDGNSVVDENRIYRYHAKAQYFTNTDFSTEDGYIAGGALTNGKDNILYIKAKVQDTTPMSIVKEDNSDNQFIRMSITDTTNDHGVYVRQDAEYSRINDNSYLDGANVYVIEAGIKASSAGTRFKAGRMVKYDTSSSKVTEHLLGNGKSYTPFTAQANVTLNTDMVEAESDSYTTLTKEDGWSKPVLVIKRGLCDHDDNAETANALATMYDVYDGANDTYVGTSIKGKSDSWTINTIGIMDVIASDSPKVGDYADIDYIRVRADRLMTVLDDGKNTNDYDAGQREVVINLTDDVKASSLETITVKDSENTPANISNISLSEDKRSITIEFADDLYSESYTVDLSGVTNEQGILPYDTEFTFVVDSTVPYVKKTPSSYVETGTSATLSAEFFNYKEACVAYIAVYDGDQIVKIEPATVEDYVDEETTPTRTIEASITLPSSFTGTKAVKLFVWKDFETLEPITRVFNCL